MARPWKLWVPVLAAGLLAAIWILLGLLAPVDGCYSEDQGFPESLTIGVVAVAVLAGGYLGWTQLGSIWPALGYALAASVVVVVALFFLFMLWTVDNGCPISER